MCSYRTLQNVFQIRSEVFCHLARLLKELLEYFQKEYLQSIKQLIAPVS